MLIGADTFLIQLRGNKRLWLAGRYSSGKTLLATALARAISVQQDVPVLANYPISGGYLPLKYLREVSPLVYQKCLDNDLTRCLVSDAVVVFDEAADALSASRGGKAAFRAVTAFLGKRNITMLLPSVIPIDRRLTYLTVFRRWDLSVFGPPIRLYQWKLNIENVIKDSGWFAHYATSEDYAAYDRFYEPSILDDLMMVSLLISNDIAGLKANFLDLCMSSKIELDLVARYLNEESTAI